MSSNTIWNVAAWVLSIAVLYGTVKVVQAFPKASALLGF